MTAVIWTEVAGELAFTLNGVEVRSTIDLATTAFDLLRHDFRLTSVRSACDGIGMCGACTILVNGRASPSCLLLAIDLAGARVETVDALADGERLHPLQQAFVAKGALQCGYCTAGMLLAAKALLDETPRPTRDQIARALTGNLCRCTGYAKIFDAIEAAAKELKSGSKT
jgi:aerobic-type carbon monoxide dehydrogenase small subunit (CoxS/CutS family)